MAITMTGCYAYTKGNITLTNVQSNHNWGVSPTVQASGAVLVNESGTGNISISKSSFNDNVGYGLLLRTNGNVTLNGVTANKNDLYRCIDRHLANPAKVVAISGMSTFYDNGDSGLEVYATGAITLTNVDAAGNGYYGAYLNNTYGTLPANVSLLGTLTNWINWFGDNDEEGLYVLTNGAVVVNKLDASNNESNGVYINNSTATLPANVTINTGWYNSNDGAGLVLRTKGTVLINSLTANYNTGGVGASINNDDDTSGTKSVTINKSTFNGNSSNGFQVGSHGNIILNAITASDNTGARFRRISLQPGSHRHGHRAQHAGREYLQLQCNITDYGSRAIMQ